MSRTPGNARLSQKSYRGHHWEGQSEPTLGPPSQKRLHHCRYWAKVVDCTRQAHLRAFCNRYLETSALLSELHDVNLTPTVWSRLYPSPMQVAARLFQEREDGYRTHA